MGYATFHAGEDDWDDRDGPGLERLRRRSRPARRTTPDRGASRHERLAARRPENESFRCRRCRAMVGPTVDGGRHRNHCPYCLHSRHVDERLPGDRVSRCRALMEPVGLFARRSEEQVLVHRCLGCGIERHNRVAADDDPLGMMRLPLRVDAGPSAADLAAGL